MDRQLLTCILYGAANAIQEHNSRLLQWNLDLTKSLGTGQICSLNGGFVISRFFSIHFTVTLAGT